MTKKPVKYYVVDAFTESAFKGNPAAVCLLEEEKDEEWLQAVASEFNLSQTCYLTRLDPADSPSHPRFLLRWFTPVAEVKLCGHATMAASHLLFANGLVTGDTIEYSTLSGKLYAKRVPETGPLDPSTNVENGKAQRGFSVELSFPPVSFLEFDSAEAPTLSKGLKGAPVLEINKTGADDLLVLLPSGEAVSGVDPQIDEIQRCPGRGVIITGPAPPGSGFDFISRFFCPKMKIPEDPVCGSAHCVLAPYWAKKLGKTELVAYQASPRGGVLILRVDDGDQRVFLRGKSAVVMEGCILV